MLCYWLLLVAAYRPSPFPIAPTPSCETIICPPTYRGEVDKVLCGKGLLHNETDVMVI